jgi:hypothetical protein
MMNLDALEFDDDKYKDSMYGQTPKGNSFGNNKVPKSSSRH